MFIHLTLVIPAKAGTQESGLSGFRPSPE